MNIIATRADLDATQGTLAHAEFMSMLAGSIYHAQKDDDLKKWVLVQNTDMIKAFGFAVADFPGAPKPELPTYIEEAQDLKMVGIQFDGVMCSATRDDQNGLMAVLMAHQMQGAAFKPTAFVFANGETLVLTKDNVPAFTAAWMPFRQSFFEPKQA